MPDAYPFLYAAPRSRPDRPVNIATSRDPEANTQLKLALFEKGYGFGDSILNYPPRERSFELFPPHQLKKVSLPQLRPGDVLLASTRPPLSDGHQNDKKKVEPSNTVVERAIFMHWWRYFRRVARSSVVFTEAAASYLPEGKKDRGNMTFFQDGCRYMYLQPLDGKRSPRAPLGQRTAAFLLRVDEVWPGGPGLLAAWGLDALATLAWCTLLRHSHAALLDKRGLTMVELHPTETPQRPDTHAWVRDWRVSPVFSTEVELDSRPEEKINHLI